MYGVCMFDRATELTGIWFIFLSMNLSAHFSTLFPSISVSNVHASKKNEAWSFFNVLIWASLITNGNKSIFTFLLVIEVFSWMNSLFVTFGYFYIAQFAVDDVYSLHANTWFAAHILLISFFWFG